MPVRESVVGQPMAFEPLEPRVLLSVNIEVDYTYDTNGFFDDPARRVVMEAAADYVSSLFNDSLNAIIPNGGNAWRIQFINPATGSITEVENPTIDEDELLLFVGGRDLADDTLGLGGAGGWQASGSSAFLNNVEGRGQSGATGPESGQTDTSLWGGTITFDSDTNWHFGVTTAGQQGNEHDFYSVALHEMMHVMGFTDDSPAFFNLISPSSEFMGARAMSVSADTQLIASDLAHWREGLTSGGQETLMDPTFTRGTRKLLTPLDFAAMEDIGWEIDAMRWPGLGAFISTSPFTGEGVASGNTTNSSSGLHWVQVREDGLLDFRVTSDQPVSLRLWDSQGLLVAENTTADTVTGLAVVATDQFYTIEVIGTAPASYDMAVATGGFDEVAYYPEGFASADIDQAVYVSNPTDSAQLFTLTLRYERDDLGRDGDAIVVDRVIEPGATMMIDIARDGAFAVEQASGRQILANEPYALVLGSTAPLGAALEHADVFGGQRITTSESFTRQTADTWHFPRAEAFTSVSDFLIFYNPNDHDARIEVTFVSTSGQITLTQVVRAEARGGWSVGEIAVLAGNAFGVILTSEAADPADQGGHDGIVAALTHFDATDGVGWTALGTPGSLPSINFVPVAEIPGSTTELLVFNPGISVARLNVIATTSMGDEMLAERFVPAGNSSALVVPNALGYRYEFTSGIGVVQFVQSTSEEAFSSAPPGAASTDLAFSLGTFDPSDAGSFLRLGIYNDSASSANVTVRFLFLSGEEVVQSVSVDAGRFSTVQIDTITTVRDRAGDLPLSIVLESPQPITGLLLSIDGQVGWGVGGLPVPA